MARNDTKWLFKQARSGSGPRQWLLGFFAIVCLGLSASATAEVHPYERWAKELGIDLNASYDGIRLMEFQGNSFQATERRAPGKMYTEVDMGGMSTGVIVREDRNKSYMLMPSMGYYREESLKGGLMQASNGMEFRKIEKVGREDVIGFPSTKYKTRFEDKDGKGAGIIWVTDSGVPIKMDMIYSNKDMKGQRYSVQFTELHLREQDPAYFEVPENLKPMGMGSIGDLMKMGAASQGTAAASAHPTAAQSSEELSEKQQACLKEAAARAAEEREKAEKKQGFGGLMSSLARTASRFSLSDIGKLTGDIYGASATPDDVSAIAEELGVTEEDVERCRQP